MKLNFKEFGSGPPMIILHGLLGSLDNWQTLAGRFSENFHVYTIDQRNHGKSPHSEEISYDLMARDLRELCRAENISNPILIGHSMGGKAAMKYALKYPNETTALISVDMSPRKYGVHHRDIFEALSAVDFEELRSRKDVEEFLYSMLKNMGVVYFLTKNLFWKEKDRLDYRFNLDVLRKNLEVLGDWNDDRQYSGKSLFIRAGQADYISDNEPSIAHHFSNANVETIDSGHWVHAEKPEEFYRVVMEFLQVYRL